MMRLFALLALVVVALAGCGKGNDVGETVPGPPRELVEKSFKPPSGGSTNSTPTTTGQGR